MKHLSQPQRAVGDSFFVVRISQTGNITTHVLRITKFHFVPQNTCFL